MIYVDLGSASAKLVGPSRFDLKENEKIIREEGANMWRGPEAVGGKIVITNKRIVFQPHSINIQTEIEEIKFGDIAEIKLIYNMFIVPNGLLLRLNTGQEKKFVVWNRAQLKAQIEELLPR